MGLRSLLGSIRADQGQVQPWSQTYLSQLQSRLPQPPRTLSRLDHLNAGSIDMRGTS